VPVVRPHRGPASRTRSGAAQQRRAVVEPQRLRPAHDDDLASTQDTVVGQPDDVPGQNENRSESSYRYRPRRIVVLDSSLDTRSFTPSDH
jgi:hypothetical protein